MVSVSTVEKLVELRTYLSRLKVARDTQTPGVASVNAFGVQVQFNRASLNKEIASTEAEIEKLERSYERRDVRIWLG